MFVWNVLNDQKQSQIVNYFINLTILFHSSLCLDILNLFLFELLITILLIIVLLHNHVTLLNLHLLLVFVCLLVKINEFNSDCTFRALLLQFERGLDLFTFQTFLQHDFDALIDV